MDTGQMAQQDKSKREERLVKALRDNLRRRKPALGQSAKATPDGKARADSEARGASKQAS